MKIRLWFYSRCSLNLSCILDCIMWKHLKKIDPKSSVPFFVLDCITWKHLKKIDSKSSVPFFAPFEFVAVKTKEMFGGDCILDGFNLYLCISVTFPDEHLMYSCLSVLPIVWWQVFHYSCDLLLPNVLSTELFLLLIITMLTICIIVLQLSRIIYLFSSNMHDASLSLSIHTTCARLMLNLVCMLI